LDDEGRPPAARKHPAQGGQQGAVGVIEPRLDLAAHDRQLVTKDQDLNILVVGGTQAEEHKVNGPTGGTVEEAKRHEGHLAG
jgi:hypothetical protein